MTPCVVERCPTTVPADKFFCDLHWSLVPQADRDRMGNRYGGPKFWDAVRAAVQTVRLRESMLFSSET